MVDAITVHLTVSLVITENDKRFFGSSSSDVISTSVFALGSAIAINGRRLVDTLIKLWGLQNEF